MIPFNKPHLTGKETYYIEDAVSTGKISGNGKYTQLCQQYLQGRYGFGKCFLTSSCTDALEMAAILLDIKAGDEVIMPSYTFVSTANAFVLRGAKIVFADSMKGNPNIDTDEIEAQITPKTKAIVPVHYAGIACNMDKIMELAEKYNLYVVEDAAQAIDSYYTGKDGRMRALGSIGHLATFSFHETKNIISGEGGMLVINDLQFAGRAEIIWEKGTNRSAFFRGEVNKYNWVDIGSSFLPSEITAAFLWAQLECLDEIQCKRREIWDTFYSILRPLEVQGFLGLPDIPSYSSNNAHIFYLLCSSREKRNNLIEAFRKEEIYSIFHYLSLHNSPFFKDKHDGRILNQSDLFSDTLIRLPLFIKLTSDQIDRITETIYNEYRTL
ncbi:MAG: dTDP-4-amino-4,6-dideoxygalactose transaminase [Flavobacteriaceae bacterium]|nr:dTDP-4-amino-4,6-dideoxygalactose transaminase [Flavobacteriaceae bacterium]